MEETLAILLNYLKSNSNIDNNYRDAIIILSSRFNEVQKNNVRGIITNSELNVERHRLINSTLNLIHEMERTIPQQDRHIEIKNSKNVIVGGKINVSGNFSIGDEVRNSEQLVAQLLQKQSKIKILFLASNPLDANPLRLDKEMRDIETELIRSKHRDYFEFIKFSAVRIKDLQDALLNFSPNFVHFSGHGNSKGIALLDNQTDKIQMVHSQPLANLFKLFSNDVACVFLNSCYSKKQATLIRKFIPNVIGMKQAVPDNTAIEFATVFYKGIGAGKEIGFSFELAKNSIDLNNISGSNIPEYL
jgi:hypothetical protein